MKVRIVDEYDHKKPELYHTEHPNEVATYAMMLIDKHAMVAALPDGEDSAGRMKLRIQTPKELVDRSFAIAELAYTTARLRNHMIDVPDLKELNAEYDAKRQAKKDRDAELAQARKA
jgi:hypothetical protein